jgi:TolB-like protein/DNA-binding winged helix-turn-helix (wHTH) protein
MRSDDAAQSTPAGAEERGYGVADLVLDVGRQCVNRADTEIPLSPRSFALLLALVRAAPDVLSVEQLMDRVWPGRVVGPETVSQRIRILREALGDSARAPRYVAGVRGRGYRMAAAVGPCEPYRQPSAPSASAAPSVAAASAAGVAGVARRRVARRSAWIAGAGLVMLVAAAAAWWSGRMSGQGLAEPSLTGPARASIAVLPFTDMSPERDQEYFSDGLAEEVGNLLARSPGLRVIARTSSFTFKNKEVDIATIARRLDVTHVLEGSVRKWGDRIRITVQLVDATTSSDIWSETYDRSFEDIFAAQQDVAASVARALQVTLDVEQPRSAVAPDPRAYESYLKARFFYHRRAEGDLERAKHYFLDALALAPDDARLWAGLAGVYGLEFGRGGPRRADALAKQGEAAQKAVALDPRLSEAHTRMSHYFRNAGAPHAAAREHREALALDPQDPLALAYAAGSAFIQGKLDQAIELQERAVSVDPAAFVHQANLAAYLAAAGRLKEAKAALLYALELNPAPTAADTIDGVGHEVALAQWLILLGELDGASALVEQLPLGADRDQCLALIEHARGRYAAADAALQRLAAASYDATDAFRVAEVFAYRGEHDSAFEWLEAGLDRIRDELRLLPEYPHERWWIYQIQLRGSPFLRPLRSEPRWQTLFEAGERISHPERSGGQQTR